MMDAAPPARLRELFDAAVSKPLDERLGFLQAACHNEPELLRQLISLIEIFAEVEGSSVSSDPLASQDSSWLGSTETGAPDGLERLVQVGSYSLIRQIGKGGMGVVYEAEQANPRRRVALKLLRRNMISPELIGRFSLESALLGRLQHPGIARIYEAGSVTSAERQVPFFAMELVHGEILTAYADSMQLSLKSRLELMAEVCDAAQHAHDQGVVHLDLKPANILVESGHRPKILDFGIARVVGPAESGAGRRSIQLVGTIRYMSPEQTEGRIEELGPASDVYSLGIVTYELLAGTAPYNVAGLPTALACEVIRREPPARLGGLPFFVRRELSAVIDRALRKQESDRYQSARAFAEDLRKVARSQATGESSGSLLQRFRRWAAREERIGQAGSGLVLVCSVVAVFNLIHLLFGVAVGVAGSSAVSRFGFLRAPTLRYWEFMWNVTGWMLLMAGLAWAGRWTAKGHAPSTWLLLLASFSTAVFSGWILAGHPYDVGGVLADAAVREGIYTIFFALAAVGTFLSGVALFAQHAQRRWTGGWVPGVRGGRTNN